MATGKNHSIRHTPGDVARFCDAINVSCDAPEEAHKKWVKEQGVCTNQGPQVQLTMMLHSLRKEASSLLCEAVQGSVSYSAYSAYYSYLFYSAARIDDGDEIDDWVVNDYRTGNPVPLRADRWYQRAPTTDPNGKTLSGDVSGIRINIWNRAKVRRLLTHNLAGGGSHNLGYHALRWETILHGNAGEMGKYAVLSVLPDKIACFLYEYHDTSYTSLALPALPLDRSTVSVHAILKPDQVLQICKICIICIICHYCIFYICCIFCICNVNMLFRIMLYWALCVFIPPTTTGVTLFSTPPS